MTRESFWKKWGLPTPDTQTYNPETKREFMEDLKTLIEKHKAPYIGALGNISQEIEDILEGEIKDAEDQAKRLG